MLRTNLYIARRLTARARVATVGIAISMVVMLLSVAIVVGFKDEVRQRIIDYSGHLQVTLLQSGSSYELPAINVTQSLIDTLMSVPGIVRVEPFATKPAVIKDGDAFVAVVAKAKYHYDSDDENENAERSVTLSETIARQLNVGVGDKVTLYFIETDRESNAFELGAQGTKVRQRRVPVVDTYASHFSEIDRQLVFVPAALIDTMPNGITLWIDDFDRLQERYYDLSEVLMDTPLMVVPVTYLYPQVFSWLELLDTNVLVILILMSAVAVFTIIGGLVIIVLEQTRLIALLRAQGLSDRNMRQTFILVALRLALRGMLWGNLIGIGLCVVQHEWHVLALDPATYYLEWVPVHLSVGAIFALNIATLIIIILALQLPSRIVSRISPARILAAE